MSNHGPSDAFLLVGGNNLSGDTYQLEDTLESLTEQTNGLGDGWEEHKPINLARVQLMASGGIYDDRTAGIVDALQAAGSTQQIVDYGFSGYAAGAEVNMLDGALAVIWKRVAARDGLVKANGQYVVTGNHRRGVVVSGLGAFTTDPFNTRLTSVDRSLAPDLVVVAIVSSSVANPTNINAPAHGLVTGDIIIISGHSGSTPTINGQRTVTVVDPNNFTIPVNVTVGGTGGTFVKVTSASAVLNLHVPELTLDGHTNFVATPVHSADNTTFVTLGSAFTAVTLPGASEQKTVAGPVQRYVALDGDFGGAGGAGRRVVPYLSIAR